MIEFTRHNRPLYENTDHPGLALDKGLDTFHENDTTRRGQHFSDIIKEICKTRPSKLYHQAYERWLSNMIAGEHIAVWVGELENRLLIGSGEFNPIEAGISMHRAFGTPFISGAAIKGCVRAYARKVGVSSDSLDVLLGAAAEGKEEQQANAGYLIFHDAWWVPNASKPPYVEDVVTVHHPNYYQSKGETPATDFDSPNPNVQIAAQGSFLFSIEGHPTWINWAMSLLKNALQNEGVGAKVSSGYGYFTNDELENKQLKQLHDEARKNSMTIEERIEIHVNEMTEDAVIMFFGKPSKYEKEILNNYELNKRLGMFLEKVKEKFAPSIKSWQALSGNDNKAKRRAYKRLYLDG